MFDSMQDQLLERIATPLSDDAPTGVDLRENMGPTSLYSRLRDARSEARGQERSLDNDPGANSPSNALWNQVASLAEEALTTQTRDLEIACWLIEALSRLSGLTGFALGANVMTTLVQSFWQNGLYPVLEADDPEARTFAVSGLSGSDKDGSLMQPLRKTVLFNLSDGTPLTFWEYERARELVTVPDQAKAKAKATVPLETMESLARGAGRTNLIAIGQNAIAARDAWERLQAAFETVQQTTDTLPETPSMSRVARILDELVNLVSRYVPEHELAPAAVVEEAPMVDDTETAAGGDVPPQAVQDNGTPRAKPVTRDDLLDEILRIAGVFREREPNSPFSYTLEDAVRRARMPLPALLLEVVSDAGARAEILTRLGIQIPDA